MHCAVHKASFSLAFNFKGKEGGGGGGGGGMEEGGQKVGRDHHVNTDRECTEVVRLCGLSN